MSGSSWRIDDATECLLLVRRPAAPAISGTPLSRASAERALDGALRRGGALVAHTLRGAASAVQPGGPGASFGRASPFEAGDVVRRALLDGRLLALRVQRPEIVGLPKPTHVAKAPPGRAKEPESITFPRWSTPIVVLGSEVFAVVSYTEIKSPVRATIVVSEVDRGGSGRQEVARVPTTIPTGTGDHKVKWKRSADDAARDLADDQRAGELGPLEYRFRVESEDPSCADESGPLWLTNTVNVTVVHEEDRRKHEPARVVVLSDAIGRERRKWTKSGRAKFEDVLVGSMHLRLAEPTFTGLVWSAPRVKVGAPVDATFRFADAMKGMEVTVIVYEVDLDGCAEEIHREEVKLDAEAGAAKMTFTRSEEDVEHDLANDARDGDTGPLEYRFAIAVDGAESERSNALWLTHELTLTVEDTAPEGAYPEGAEVVLLTADGAEHRAPFDGADVMFDDVVCGPFTVKIDVRSET